MKLICINYLKSSIYHFSLLLILSLLFSTYCEASEERPPAIGNFALPNSQQPGPLISFGENIIDKNQTQLFLFADDYAGVNKHFVDVVPSVLYGITDNLSLFLNLPYAASYEVKSNKSTGIEDAYAQLEYAFYKHSTSSFVDQSTIVMNMSVPSGSIYKNPPTGLGSPSFFIGPTFNRTYINWFIFGSPGALLTTAKNGTKFGNNYLYQFGFGRNIADKCGWLFAWMTEIDGTYAERNRVQGIIDPNSGGNVVYITPSIWASTKKFIFQFGVGLPATQHLFGNQSKDTLLIATNIGWSFY